MSATAEQHRVCHVINTLRVGGAQSMLAKMLSQLDLDKWEHHVIALIDEPTPLAKQLRDTGVSVVAAGLPHRIPTPRGVLRLVTLLRTIRPDIVQTWLFHSDLLGGLAAKCLRRRTPVVWNIRRGKLVKGIDKPTTFWTAALCARLSRYIPNHIIVNSQHVYTQHAQRGYCTDRMSVIPNGFDTSHFQPSQSKRQQIRRELGLSDEAPLIGLVGRYHPVKDHGTFLRSARLILQEIPDAHFLLCGNDVVRDNSELWQEVQSTGASQHFHLLGCRDDMASIQATLDVATSSSVDEGFPNVIGEAMACAVPCVVTDVGGSAELVGDVGDVVPARDAQSFSKACIRVLKLPQQDKEQLGSRARSRIVKHFGLDVIARQYEQLWQRVMSE